MINPVTAGQEGTLTFSYNSKYVGQIEFKVIITKIIDEAASGCHQYQAVATDKGLLTIKKSLIEMISLKHEQVSTATRTVLA